MVDISVMMRLQGALAVTALSRRRERPLPFYCLLVAGVLSLRTCVKLFRSSVVASSLDDAVSLLAPRILGRT